MSALNFLLINLHMDLKHCNSQNEKLLLPEYGRHIQNMVMSLKNIENREDRTRQACAVISVMGNLNSQLRDTADFRHKLWDHLFIMANFELDVDSPYNIPSSESLTYHPEKIEYPSGKITYKQYGKNIRSVINLIKEFDSKEDMAAVAADISKFMKFKSYEYNQEYPSDEVIIEDIRKFSNGIINLEDDSLHSTKLNHRNQKNSGKILANDKARRTDNKSRPNSSQPHSKTNVTKNNSSKKNFFVARKKTY